MTERNKAFDAPLRALAAVRSVLGSVLVTRDGFCALNACPPLGAPETFSAMGAALVGAAEMALSELGGATTPKVVVDGEKHTLIAVGVTDDLLLLILAQPGTRLEDLTAAIAGATNSIRQVAAA